MNTFYKNGKWVFEVTKCETFHATDGAYANITYKGDGKDFDATVPCNQVFNLDDRTAEDLRTKTIPAQFAEFAGWAK